MIYGYCGKILRVDLTKKIFSAEHISEDILEKYIGGAALGIKLIYDEVKPNISWSDHENRLFFGSGPLGGTVVGGSGNICGVTVGALTNGMACSQANGFFGAFLRFSGFDAVIIQGASSDWVYLYIHDGNIEIKEANHLVGLDIYESDTVIKNELSKQELDTSVLTIGPAGENLVRFACISVDKGHMIAHNGFGAVMGSKKLKAIAIKRSKTTISFKDKELLSETAKKILVKMRESKTYDMFFNEGTVGGVVPSTKAGIVPVKNYTSSLHVIDTEKLEAYTSQNIRSRFKIKHKPCWACQSKHLSMMEIPTGKYAGRVFEEPEYEPMASWSSLIGVTDVETTLLLASEVDRLGLDTNESGWVISWLIECYGKQLVNKSQTDGLEMGWGKHESILEMLNRIAQRKGFGNILAEGVMRAAKQIGGEAQNFAIHTLKGNTPRSHDHRLIWPELFSTCVSNIGTIETHQNAPYDLLGLPPFYDVFDPVLVSGVEAKIKGAMIFEDSSVTCRFQTATRLDLLCQAINAATGWNIDVEEAMHIGKRAVNIARLFNIQRGIGAELDYPSVRYGSSPVDGSAAGKSIMLYWDKMLSNYYGLMGWDSAGKPMKETLQNLELTEYLK